MADTAEIREHCIHDNERKQVDTRATSNNMARVHSKKKEEYFAILAQGLQQYFTQMSEKTLSLILSK